MKKLLRIGLAIALIIVVLMPTMPVAAQADLTSSFSKHCRTTTTSTDFHLTIGLAAAVYVPEWEVWPGGPVVPARWDIDWRIARAPTYKIFNHETPGAFLFEDIQFNISDVGKTYTISSVNDDPDFDDFVAFLTNGTDDNIWDAWIWPMHPTNNAGGIRCAGGPRGFHFESDVFPGIDVGSDHPGWTVQSVSLTFDDIATSMLTIDYTVDIAYGPAGNPGPPGAPTNFTLALSNGTIEASWMMGEGALTTVVMRQANRYPIDVMDGVEAYNGPETNFTDPGLNVEDNEYFYRAWSYDDVEYSTDYAENNIGGTGMITIGLLFVCLGLTVISLVWKMFPLMIVASVAWFGSGAYFLGNHTVGDLEWVIGAVSMMVGVYCIIHALWLLPKGRKGMSDEDEERTYRKEVLNVTKRRR